MGDVYNAMQRAASSRVAERSSASPTTKIVRANAVFRDRGVLRDGKSLDFQPVSGKTFGDGDISGREAVEASGGGSGWGEMMWRKRPELLAGESFRGIAARLLHLHPERRMQTHVIASAQRKEGRTSCAVRLAWALSQNPGTRVLLLETDLVHPSLKRWFRQVPRRGLAAYLHGDLSLEDLWDQAGDWAQSLSVIFAGVVPSGASGTLLSDARLSVLLDRAKDLFDHVVLDSPALNECADACLLGRVCDQVIMTVALGKTPAPGVSQAKQRLAEHDSCLAGVILTHGGDETVGLHSLETMSAS